VIFVDTDVLIDLLRGYAPAIAETAVGLNVPLHTFNVSHLRAIQGLFTAQPYLKRRQPCGHPDRC